MDVPNELRLALAKELRGRKLGDLSQEASALSARYREQRAPATLAPESATAYAATRMPATFAAASAAFQSFAALFPGFEPRSMLDAGAGTGAALWAAASIWPSLDTATLLERSRPMAELGRRLVASSRRRFLTTSRWRTEDLSAPWAADAHELVTATYVLGELASRHQAALVSKLWDQTTTALVLVEPGTPQGWATIRAAREQLRASGACIVAPCPHQGLCPLPADDWCHFAQRLARSRDHRAAKGAALSYEDEKYSYVAVARSNGDPIGARALRRPAVRPGRIELELCATTGLRHITVTKSRGEAWRLAQALRWGDALPPGAIEEI